MRYLNPGYAELFQTSGLTNVTNSTYNPYAGVSVATPSSQSYLICESGTFSPDVECQFNCYVAGSSAPAFYIGFCKPSSTDYDYIAGLWISNTAVNVHWGSGTSNRTKVADAPPKNTLNNIWFNIWIHNEDYGGCSVCVNDGEEVSVDFVPGSNFSDPDNLTFRMYPTFSSSTAVYISNLIITDEGRIDPREKVFPLPVSAVTTDMTESNGIYIADDVGQTLLQTPDVEDLILNYGANSQVTGIGILGNNAYKTGTGMSQLIGVHKKGNTVTEHDACTLTTTARKIFNGWDMTNTKITDLRNMQFGLKAGV